VGDYEAPLLRRNASERVVNLSVELQTNVTTDLRAGFCIAAPPAKRTAASNRIICVSDLEDPCFDRDLISSEPPWIAGPVDPFVVAEDDRYGAAQHEQVGDQGRPYLGMSVHLRLLGGAEGCWLVQEPFPKPEIPDVVQ